MKIKIKMFGRKLLLGLNLFLVVNSNADDENNVNIAYYEEIKDLANHPEKYLIDVREPHELEELGRIPNSINIPLAMVKQALSNTTNSELFKEEYGKEKPELNTPIIFTCRSGRRSLIAYNYAKTLGYDNLKNYGGSWLDWTDRESI